MDSSMEHLKFDYFYRPQAKLREGNVFTGVCDSVHRGGLVPGGVPGPGGCLVGEGDLVLGGVWSGGAWSWGDAW